MKKVFSVILSFILIICLLMPATVQAFAADSDFDTDIINPGDLNGDFETDPIENPEPEKEPVIIEVTEENGTAAIYKALCDAREQADAAHPYEIHVAAGEYSLNGAFHIFSNTSIIADENAHFVMVGKVGEEENDGDNMLKVGTTGNDPASGYYYENITVSGGEWDANGFAKTMFKFVHAKNCVLENVRAHDIYNAHFVEVAGVDGFTVAGCSFYNMHVDVGDGREAIQIDVLQEGHIQGYEHLDDEIDYLCKNISISGCTFTGVRRGIASHTVVHGKYFENIEIIGNTFNDTEEKSILCYNMKDLVVKDNIINGTDVGIEVKTMDQNGAGTYLSANDRSYDEKANPVYLGAEICNNTVVSKSNHAIFVNGIILRKDVSLTKKYNGEQVNYTIPKGNYYVDGVNIHDNTLTAYGNKCAVKVKYGKNCTVNKNTVTASTTSETPIYITDETTKTAVTNNNILSTVVNGIRVCNFTYEDKPYEAVSYSQCNITSISGNTIANVNSKGYGIRISDAAVGTVDKNTIKKSANLGIQADKNVKKVAVNSISGNVINSARIAIRIMKATIGNINSNKLYPTTYDSLVVDDRSVVSTIDKNVISKPGDTGIVLHNSKITQIVGNTITSPKGMGIYCYGGYGTDKISGNAISGAKTNGICANGVVIKSIDSNTISSCKNIGIYINGTNTKTQINAIKSNKVSSCTYGYKILKGAKVNLYVNGASKNSGGNRYVINGSKQYKLGNEPSVSLSAKKSGKTVKLTWKKKTYETGYLIYRSVSSKSGFAKIGGVSGSATAFTDKTAKAKTTYYYRILPYYKVPGSNVTIYANWTQSKAVKM